MPTIGDVSPALIAVHAFAGGNTSHALTKTSAADYAFGWSNPATPYPQTYVSGNWYDNRVVVDFDTSTSSAFINCIYVPCYFTSAVSVTAIGCYVVAGTGLAMKVGINTMDPITLRPAQLLVSASGTSATQTSITITTTTVPAGWNFLAFAGSSTGVAPASAGPYCYRVPWAMNANGPQGGAPQTYWTQSGSGSNTPLSYPTVNGGTNSTPPTIRFKVA